VKLSPGALDVIEIAQAVEAEGADAVSLINTLVGMSIDPRTKQSRIANTTGGLSGPAVKPVAVRMVYQVASAVRIPVIGIGGISGLNDALEFFMAGASAIQVGTAIFSTPTMLTRLIDDLGAWLDTNGYASLRDIVGVANPRFASASAFVPAEETLES
jgi:dihydroorotate dehydrogenase (NAD+) catalytic subunit